MGVSWLAAAGLEIALRSGVPRQPSMTRHPTGAHGRDFALV
jgi:hypothetical protein